MTIHFITFFIVLGSWLLAALGSFLYKKEELGALLNIIASAVSLGCLSPFLIEACISDAPINVNFVFQVCAPFYEFYIHADALSLVFMTLLFTLSGLFSLYSMKQQPLLDVEIATLTGRNWGFFSLMILSMFVVLAGNGVLSFMLGWEGMTLSAFALLMIRGVKRKTYAQAPWLFLAFSQVAAFALLAAFMIVFSYSKTHGHYDFETMFLLIRNIPASAQSTIFFLFVLGFGVKMAMFPFYGWLPKTYSESTIAVTGLLSGVMINLAVYGFFRILEPFYLFPQPYWGLIVIILGALTVIAGAYNALIQKKIKKVLAYSSIENMGIILMGIGLSLSAAYDGKITIVVLAIAASFLHAFNHALIKPYMFMIFDVSHRAIGTQNINESGGLLRFGHGGSFGVGAMAMSALPPFICFASEILLFMAVFETFLARSSIELILSATIVATALSLGSGMTIGAYIKAFGLFFLGHFRGEDISKMRQKDRCMSAACSIYTYIMISIGLLQPLSCYVFQDILSNTLGIDKQSVANVLLRQPFNLLTVISILLVIIMIFFFFRKLNQYFSRYTMGRTYGPTWCCAYSNLNSKMQYTSSSFSEPVTEIANDMLPQQSTPISRKVLFPSDVLFDAKVDTRLHIRMICLFKQGLERLSIWVYKFENGSIQLFVLFIIITLIAMIVFKFF